MDRISDNLYLSSIFHSKLKSKLKNNNIVKVLSILSTDLDKTEPVANDSSSKENESKIIQHTSKNFSRDDIEHKAFTTVKDVPKSAPILSEILPECLKFIHTSRSSSENILVHCVAGRSRSATVVVAYLMVVTGLGFEQVYEKVLERRAVQPNFGFLSLLAKLDASKYREALGVTAETMEVEKAKFLQDQNRDCN